MFIDRSLKFYGWTIYTIFIAVTLVHDAVNGYEWDLVGSIIFGIECLALTGLYGFISGSKILNKYVWYGVAVYLALTILVLMIVFAKYASEFRDIYAFLFGLLLLLPQLYAVSSYSEYVQRKT